MLYNSLTAAITHNSNVGSGRKMSELRQDEIGARVTKFIYEQVRTLRTA